MSQHGCPERLSNRSKGFQEEGGSQATMELLVETLTGTAFEMTVSPSDTIFAIKSKIYRVEGIPIAAQHLVYNLQELADSVCVGELRMGAGARLRLVLGMRGGPVSTRRLPPPAPVSEPWPHIERLLDSNRDELELGGGGCKVTVLVFRDGERVNMLRVRENTDGTYSPLDTTKYSASVPCLSEAGAEPAAAAGALRENAVTMGKMLELRRRMEALSVQRAACPHHAPDDKAEMCKTRSEEMLPAARELASELCAQPYAYDADECFALPHDSNYTRYSYECGFGSRYTLLPPIGARDAADDARHTALQRRQVRGGGEEAAILEEVGEECVRDAAPLQPLHHHLGELVGGCAWRGHSASALQLRAGAPPDQLDAPFSSSTSELENLKRNSRLLPGLSRARPREHLHLSDEGLHLRRDQHHAAYRTRESSQPSGAEDRLYNRREMTSQPSAAEERLYMRRETTSQPCGEDRLYSRADSNNEERLYNRREKLHKDEDRLYNRRESTLPDDRLYNRRDTALPGEERLYNRRDTTLPGEERLYSRRDTTHPDDNLYRSITQTQDIYLRHDDDRLYAPTEQDDMFRDSQNIAIEERLYMHAGDNMADTLYMDRDHVLQSLNEDHTYSRNINLKDQMYEDRLYLRRDAANDDERLYNRGGRLPDKGGEQAEAAVDKVSDVTPSEPAVEVKEKKIRVRCGWCKKRLSVATVHRCRCGGAWCAQHRYSEVHGCAWDYKAESRAPPSLLPPKLPKI